MGSYLKGRCARDGLLSSEACWVLTFQLYIKIQQHSRQEQCLNKGMQNIIKAEEEVSAWYKTLEKQLSFDPSKGRISETG